MNRSLALLATLVFVAAGCGGGGEKSSKSAGGSGTRTAGNGVRVGLVTDVGGLNDRGFNHLAYVGVQQAKQRLGASFRVFLSNSSSDYVPNLTKFAREKYDIAIGVGFTEADAIDTAAVRFPDQKFAIVDVDQQT